jgi:hypothetical protein
MKTRRDILLPPRAGHHVSAFERLMRFFWSPIPWMIEIAAVGGARTLDEIFFAAVWTAAHTLRSVICGALADLGSEPQRSGEIAERLSVKTATVGPFRSKLILKGMIFSPQHGGTEFTVPVFDTCMRRTMRDGTSGSGKNGS